ncbi:Uncharacterised protein [Mycobacteroides abscessus subsp. abscessus]|nr:Uncharacterised protein [Mycobacteroides abscessus subsp. abscessus]
MWWSSARRSLISLAAMDSIAGRMCALAAGVKALLTSERSRVWSGGSVLSRFIRSGRGPADCCQPAAIPCLRAAAPEEISSLLRRESARTCLPSS